MTSRGPHPSIVRTSPPDKARLSSHPRRPPAKRSVSLLHSKPQLSRLKKQTTVSSSDGDLKRSNSEGESGATDSPSSLVAVGGKGSSGESSNVDRWFEESNNEVRENSVPFADNDPPFFMRNSSSSETPPDLRQQMTRMNNDEGTNSLPLRTGLLQLGTDGSSTEDFRSVIDDLTIENKKLKRKLKKYEKFHDSHLKNEKLFEVRIHGLPAEKKRELEDTLRKFASSLTSSGANAFPPDGYASLMPMLKGGKTTSSQASLHNADSAYASMSASGQGSTAQSGNDSHRLTPSQYPAVRQQNIRNYLHDIPEGLLPQQNPATMTERAKKKLVVRRMEQLFAGKGAAASGHQQSIQQQEVSQSAARTDKTAMEAAGQRARQEGTREAAIMDRETEDPLDEGRKEKPPPEEPTVEHQPKEKNVGYQDFAEQRPTRPLDLDPQRAQVPSDNIRYLRQMGFSPFDPESSRSPEDGHGWIYLNFLINMAQLHTINVTSDFVRKAIGEYSQKFEVSNDGRRVRWKGGPNLTRTSSSGEGSSHTGENTPDRQSPRKRLKLSHNLSTQQVGGTSQRLQSETSKFSYTPLFFHRDDSDETDDSSSEEEDSGSMSSPYRAPIHGDSSGMTSSGARTTTVPPMASNKKKHKHDDGPIIFYNNARFCTDLSGDHNTPTNYSAPIHTMASNIPIGGQRTRSDDDYEKRGPLAATSELPEPMDLSDNPIPDHMELSFPERSPARSQTSTEQKPIDLEVTGIGGVWPADNFAISVQSRQTNVDHYHKPAASANAPSNRIPERFAKILRGTDSKSTPPLRVQKQVIASKMQELPPSELPPALSFMPFGEESEDDEESDIEEESEVPGSPGILPPATAPQPVDMPYASSDEESEGEDSDDGEESDGEVDFLAGVRQVDPEAVRQKEREYDANMADRLAEEIPAGSSAATAGGGSGFASPADGVSRKDYKRAIMESRKSSEISRRPVASDSMVVHSSSESSSDEDE